MKEYRKHWSVFSELFGHMNLKEDLGTFIDFGKDTCGHLGLQYFLCRDQEDFASVEYYFSEFLPLWKQEGALTVG